ncbi:hypothetical protein [Mycobacterium numidiamassiliense]|nr:hypothetical protein [Mycobacterium numidiamassiliense]
MGTSASEETPGAISVRDGHVSAKGTSTSGKVSFTATGIYVRVGFEHFDGFGTLATPADELKKKLAKESGRG